MGSKSEGVRFRGRIEEDEGAGMLLGDASSPTKNAHPNLNRQACPELVEVANTSRPRQSIPAFEPNHPAVPKPVTKISFSLGEMHQEDQIHFQRHAQFTKHC
jgi:hypothetical protein